MKQLDLWWWMAQIPGRFSSDYSEKIAAHVIHDTHFNMPSWNNDIRRQIEISL